LNFRLFATCYSGFFTELNGYLESLATRENAQSLEFLLDLKLPIEAYQYGCPERATVQLTFNDNEPTIDCILQWFDKPACRLPEAMWFSFSPQGCSPTGWEMDVIDQKISPLDVVSKGWRNLWAVHDGVYYTDAHGSFNIQTLDAPLIAPGEPGLMAFTDRIPDLTGGMHINLYNNQWATNYPAWYDENGRFRFKLSFE
jgi:hypothetical protein